MSYLRGVSGVKRREDESHKSVGVGLARLVREK